METELLTYLFLYHRARKRKDIYKRICCDYSIINSFKIRQMGFPDVIANIYLCIYTMSTYSRTHFFEFSVSPFTSCHFQSLMECPLSFIVITIEKKMIFIWNEANISLFCREMFSKNLQQDSIWSIYSETRVDWISVEFSTGSICLQFLAMCISLVGCSCYF